MCTDTTWTAGLLGIGLQSLSAAEHNPFVKIKRGRVFLHSVAATSHSMLTMGLPSLSAAEANPGLNI